MPSHDVSAELAERDAIAAYHYGKKGRLKIKCGAVVCDGRGVVNHWRITNNAVFRNLQVLEGPDVRFAEKLRHPLRLREMHQGRGSIAGVRQGRD